MTGSGPVPLYNLMEDVATAEIRRPELAVAALRGGAGRGAGAHPRATRTSSAQCCRRSWSAWPGTWAQALQGRALHGEGLEDTQHAARTPGARAWCSPSCAPSIFHSPVCPPHIEAALGREVSTVQQSC